jgi:hypothetical protein
MNASGFARRLLVQHSSITREPVRNFWFKSATTERGRRSAQKIDWSNPGERLPYVGKEVLFGLPPMTKPFKQQDSVLRWYQLRARLVWGVFLFSGFSYAAYLHLNDRGQGRLALQRSAPQLARFFQKAGLLQPLPQSVSTPPESCTTIKARIIQPFAP